MRDIIRAAVATNPADNGLIVVDYWSLNMQSTRGIIGALHLYNNYNDSLKARDPDLPANAVRRLDVECSSPS